MTDANGKSALMHAVTHGHVGSINALLCGVSDRDALVCMKDANSMNSLMLAIKRRKPEPIKALLDTVKNPEQLIFMKNDDNKTALMLAIEQSIIADLYGDYEIIIPPSRDVRAGK